MLSPTTIIRMFFLGLVLSPLNSLPYFINTRKNKNEGWRPPDETELVQVYGAWNHVSQILKELSDVIAKALCRIQKVVYTMKSLVTGKG